MGGKNPKSGYMAEVATWPNTTKRGTSGGATDREREGWWKKRAAYHQGILTASLSILSTITPKL